MAEFSRDELEEMVSRFVAGNLEAGRTGDWSAMPQFYTEDALYSWGNGPKYEFVARGRQEIADYAYGSEMEGLETWHYPYVRTLVDEKKGEFMGFWRQLAPVKGPDGELYEIGGTGGVRWGARRELLPQHVLAHQDGALDAAASRQHANRRAVSRGGQA